jgi:two-component system response regulator YesN
MKLLIADDERPSRFVLRSFLDELGFPAESIEEASGGRELVEKAIAQNPDCVFVDIRMPGTDGLQAIEEASPSCPATHWVIVSSHAEFEYARKAIRLGVTEYLLKPVAIEELSACLERQGIRALSAGDDALLGPVVDYLKRNFNADASVSDAASIVGVSPNYLSALFHRRMGSTISDYLAKLRIEEAARLLHEGYSVTEAAQAVGYSDSRHFAKKFKAVLGCLPSDRRIVPPRS